MRVLVFCADVLPYPGLPTTGGGLRSWQWIRSLRRLGHETIASMPTFTFLARKFAETIADDVRAAAWTPNDQDELVDRYRPDAVVFASSWIVDHLRREHDCLYLHDLCGPQLLEMHYKGHLDPAGVQRKIERLARSDFVICGGRRQRYYFQSYLLQAGHDPGSDHFLPVVPLAFPDEFPVHESPDRIEIVTGGGFYPWQDPSPGLLAVRDVLARRPKLDVRVRVFGGSHHVTGADEELYRSLRRQLEGEARIEFHDFVARDEFIEICRRGSLAIDLHSRNPERELAVSTRTLDALWCGLPVLHGDYSELSDLLESSGAGWTVDPADGSSARALLELILDHPADLPTKGRNAQSSIRARFLDDRVIEPLARFLAHPVKRRPARPPRLGGWSRGLRHLLASARRRVEWPAEAPVV